jgi:2-phosphosulfolactate phosphatase
MQLHVFFTPADLLAIRAEDGPTNDVYLVIDVIRATTSMATIFDRGASRIFAADSVEQAREAVSRKPGRLLCGERHALPLPGFDYGNSPVQFSQLDLTNRELILTTTNGTRAFYACPLQATRLAGCFYNARAVVTYAFHLARQRTSNLSLVCAGELHYFALDDAVCAGFLALELQHLADEQGVALWTHESVSAAIALYHAYQPPKILEHTASAQSVFDAGLHDDPYFCMQTSQSTSIPIVIGQEEETGLLILERVSDTWAQMLP